MLIEQNPDGSYDFTREAINLSLAFKYVIEEFIDDEAPNFATLMELRIILSDALDEALLTENTRRRLYDGDGK